MDTISLIKSIHQDFERKIRLYFSRRKAIAMRKKIIKRKGFKIVDRKKIRFLKSYAKKNFGDSSYWPYLALYTELRGEFKPGWIPEDYYWVILLNKHNPEPSAKISALKTFDYRLFPDFALKPIVLKIYGHFYDTDSRLLTTAEVENILCEYNKEIVLKEDFGLGGSQVKFIESTLLNFTQLPETKNYIIQPVVNQHKVLKQVHQHSVNTIRVLTFLNETGVVIVKFAYLRFGIGKSRVDNVSAGGGVCYVKDDGHLADKAYNKFGLTIGSKHPESNTTFKTIKIPNFELALKKCKESHKKYPYVKFIGWDVTINENGEPVLLEWNTRPIIWFPEALDGPFWKDEFINN